MNDPRRLLDGDASEQERALLEAAHGEQPSAASRLALQQALGLAPVPSLAPPTKLGIGASKLAWLVGGATLLGALAFLPNEVPVDAPVTATTPAVVAPATPHALLDELRALEQVRTALVAQRAAQARTLLDAYLREHPRGALLEEARALEVEAAHALGDDARTHELARAFLRRYPTSVHAERVRAADPEARDAP